MKTFFLILIACLYISQAFSQNLTWGAEFKSRVGTAPDEFICLDDGGYFFVIRENPDPSKYSFQLAGSKKYFFLEKYTPNHRLIFRKNYEDELEPSEKWPQIFSVGKHLFLSTAIYHSDSLEFYCREVDSETGELKSERKKYTSIISRSKNPKIYLQAYHSLDSSKTALVLDLKQDWIYGSGLPGKPKFSLAVFDETQGLIWNKKVSLDEEDPQNSLHKPILNQFFLDMKGNVHLCTVNLSYLKKDGVLSYAKIYSLNSGGNPYRRVDIAKEKMGKRLGALGINDLGSIMRIAFPSNDEASIKISYLDEKSEEFSEPIIVDLEHTDRKAFATENEAAKQWIYPLKDGSKLLFQEDMTLAPGQHRDYWVYDDLHVMKLSAKDRIVWAHKIKKYQFTTRPYLGSFYAANIGDDLIILYNDDFKPYKAAKFLVYQVKINSDGELEKKVVFNGKEPFTYPYTSKGFKSTDNQVSIYCRLGTKFRMLHLEY